MNELEMLGGGLSPMFWFAAVHVIWPLVMTRVGVLGAGALPLMGLLGLVGL